MTIAGRWRVRQILEGGMSWVYIAQDLDALQQGKFLQVVLKSFKDISSPVRVRRFLAEARRWIHIGQHEHVVVALFAQEMEGWPILELEYVHGNTLKHWIDRRRLSLSQSVNFAIQLCDGMHYMNIDAGLVHRDLKPSNLLISDLNVLKITDVGISQMAAIDRETAGPNETRAIAGTPLYMSPEQFDNPTVDSRSDIYSAGVILYEMLTGRRVFSSSSYGELRSLHKDRLPVPPQSVNPAVPRSLADIVMKCLAKSPTERFTGFKEVQQALEEVNETLVRKTPFVRSQPVVFRQAMKLALQCYSMLTLRRFDEARRIGEELIKIDPQDAEGWNNVGVALTNLRNFEESCRYLQRAIELKTDFVAAMTNLGGNLTVLKRYPEGRRWLEEAARIDPGYAEAWANLGVNLVPTDPVRAFECFDRAVDADPHYWQVWVARGFACLDLDKTQEAVDCYNRAERFLVRDPRLWRLKVEISLKLGDTNKALIACDEGLSYSPDDTELWAAKIAVLEKRKAGHVQLRCTEAAIERFPEDSRFHMMRALWFGKRNHSAEAEKSFARACKLDPEEPMAFRFRAEMLIDLKRFEDATACYERAVQLEPANPSNWQGLGVSRTRLSQFAAALPALERAAELDPGNRETNNALEVCRRYLNPDTEPPKRTALDEGLDLATRGRTDAAIERLTEAIALNPNDPQSHQLRGSCYADLGRHNEALADFSRALELNPRDSLARAGRAKLLNASGRSDEALSEARLAVEAAPEFFYAHGILGNVAHSRGQFDLAATEYVAAIESLRKSAGPQLMNDSRFRTALATLHRDCGICLKELGNFDMAHHHLREALNLDASDDKTRKHLGDFD